MSRPMAVDTQHLNYDRATKNMNLDVSVRSQESFGNSMQQRPAA